MIGLGSNNFPGTNNTMIPPECMYLGGYGREYPMHHGGSPGFFSVHQQMSLNNFAQSPQSPNLNFHPGQAPMASGIDPRYLAAYSDGNAEYFAAGQQIPTERTSVPPFGSDYENRSFVAPDRSKPKPYAHQMSTLQTRNFAEKKQESGKMNNKNNNIIMFRANPIMDQPGRPRQVAPQAANKNYEGSVFKEDSCNKISTRSDKLKALHKSGTRAFSGPVDKVLKWHKALQEIGILIIYEVVAKCVSIRAGESCAKILVIRDDNGPAMQVVYYEIDFLLPELKPPCTVRVIGRMMCGACRLQAFSVRAATGDDVAALPRRAAVAAHHVAKICKEFGITA